MAGKVIRQWWLGMGLCLWLSLALPFGTAGATDRYQAVSVVTSPPGVTILEDFPANLAVFYWIHRHHYVVLDQFFLGIVYAGSGWVLLPILLWTYWRRRSRLAFLMTAVALESLLVVLIKEVVPQPRPGTLLHNFHPLVPLFYGSFPSGDTAMAFTIAACLQRGERLWLRGAWMLYAALIGIERVYLGVHFPLDVCAGGVLGCATVAGTQYAWIKFGQLVSRRHD